jgi:hypothetical protein
MKKPETAEELSAYTAEQTDECAKAIFATRDLIMSTYDARIVFACYAAVLGSLGSSLRAAKIYKMEHLVRLTGELLVTMLEEDNRKGPKITYRDGPETLGTKQ